MDMNHFKLGQSTESEVEVTTAMSVNRMGRKGADVLSTPMLLEIMENICIKSSEPYLVEGYTTVGYAVDGLRHLAPTPVGQTVRVRSVITEIDRKRLTYSIEAYEGDKKIGIAVHKRAVVSTNPSTQN